MFFSFKKQRESAESRTPQTPLFGGVAEVSPEWLEEQPAALRVIDVREPAEFNGPLGHIEGAELVPLAKLLRAAEAWDHGETLVMVCRSGARSAGATQVLGQLGFQTVYNLEGGMIAWNRGPRRERTP